MGAIRGLKQFEREEHRVPAVKWITYLNNIVMADRQLHAVCLKLDEEGKKYCEMTPVEAEMLAGKLMQVAKGLREQEVD